MQFLSTAVALITTVIFMIALRPMALSLGMVDRPGGRKMHFGDVPVIGGAAMYLGVALGLSMLPDLAEPFRNLALAAGLLVSIGILDDRFELTATVRMSTQILVVLIMVHGNGLMIWDIGDTFGFGTVSFGPLALLFTILVAISVINATNMSDGVDGLAGSLSLVTFVAIAIVTGPGTAVFQVAIVAIAAVIAYLLFNFPLTVNRPLRSFMGDGGSTMLGLIIVWVTISASQGEGRVVTPVIALWFASIPIYDLFTRFVQRLAQGRSPLSPDREHFHHILGRGGMSAGRTVAVLVALQTLYACIGLRAHYLGVSDVVMFSAWSVLGISQHAIICRLASISQMSQLRKINPEYPS